MTLLLILERTLKFLNVLYLVKGFVLENLFGEGGESIYHLRCFEGQGATFYGML